MSNMFSNHLQVIQFTENGSRNNNLDFKHKGKPPFYFYIELSKMLGVDGQINAKYEKENGIIGTITVINGRIISENQETKQK